MPTKTKFLGIFLCVFGGLFAVTALISIVIDPFGMFRVINIDGFNSKKFSYLSETFIKPQEVAKSGASYIFIGDSRANTTFASSLDHDYFRGAKIYSAGMAGHSLYADYRMLQHIQDMKISHVIVIIDHLSFFSYSPLKQSFVAENSDFSHRLNYHEDGTKNYAQWLQKFKDTLLLICSFNILQESIETIQKQNNELWYSLQNGTWGGRYAYGDKPQRKYFEAMEKDLLVRPLTSIPDETKFYDEKSNINTFSTFNNFISLAQRSKISVELIIPPTHARMFEILFSMNRWSDYEEWKRKIVSINEQVAAEQNSTPLTIWDFTSYNNITTETVPPFSEKQARMRWFDDDVHVHPEFGKLMLDEMTNYTGDNEFITKLTSMSVENQLANLRAGHKKYVQQHPKDAQQIYSFCLNAYKDKSRCIAPENP